MPVKRPWYATFLLIGEQLIYATCGFTPAPGTTPGQAARLGGPNGQRGASRVEREDDFACLYYSDGGQQVMVRYDDYRAGPHALFVDHDRLQPRLRAWLGLA